MVLWVAGVGGMAEVRMALNLEPPAPTSDRPVYHHSRFRKFWGIEPRVLGVLGRHSTR